MPECPCAGSAAARGDITGIALTFFPQAFDGNRYRNTAKPQSGVRPRNWGV
jgi:hypothetical protein